MIPGIVRYIKGLGILRIYYFALFIYILPLISLGAFLVDQFTVNKTEMVFWVIFLVSMLPYGLIGLILSLIGLIQSIKRNTRLNKVIGIVGTLGGLISLIGGILGIMLIYVVVGD